MTQAIQSQPWGIIDGSPVTLYTLTNRNGLVMKVTNFGAIITELHTPDRNGKLADIVLGFDNPDDYVAGHPHFGAVAGRCGNRIANARFDLDGTSFQLGRNHGRHHLHGGFKGFDRYVWKTTVSENPLSLTFTRLSPDGEEGYPGNLEAKVVYTLTDANELRVEFSATTDKPTICNIIQHSYWNLAGHGSGDVYGQTLEMNADEYALPGKDMIPTGEAAPVAGTFLDFRTAKPIGQDIQRTGITPIGYDHNIILRGKAGEMKLAAIAHDPASGRTLELHTDQPGCQLYTSNFLDGSLTGKGAVYRQHAGFCLETQKYPDAIHKPHWPSPILRPGETYQHAMVHKFGVK